MATTRLAQTELNSSSSTISFTSISQSYNHLEIHVHAKTDAAAANHATNLTFNNVTGGYSVNFLQSNPGNTAMSGYSVPDQSNTYGSVVALGSNNSATYSFGIGVIHIPFYTDTAIKKQAIYRTGYKNGSADYYVAGGIENNSTSAISRIDIARSSGNFLAGSVFTLYAW
jgi:hypothetical protein